MDEFTPIQSDEELKELHETIKNSDAVKKTVETKGWQIIKGMLEDKIVELNNKFLKANAYEEFVKVQQAMNAILNTLKLMEGIIALGDQAKERIRLQNEANKK